MDRGDANGRSVFLFCFRFIVLRYLYLCYTLVAPLTPLEKLPDPLIQSVLVVDSWSRSHE
jgi:hypothetical protein